MGNVKWPNNLLSKISHHYKMFIGLNMVINTYENCFLMIMWSLCCPVAPCIVYNSLCQSLQLMVILTEIVHHWQMSAVRSTFYNILGCPTVNFHVIIDDRVGIKTISKNDYQYVWGWTKQHSQWVVWFILIWYGAVPLVQCTEWM